MKEPNLRPAFILAGAGMLYVGNELNSSQVIGQSKVANVIQCTNLESGSSNRRDTMSFSIADAGKLLSIFI